MATVVWVLDVAQVVVLVVVVAGNVAVVDGDVAVELWGSGLKRRGCGSCWGSISRLSRVCCHFRDAGGSFSAGDRKVVVVVDNVVAVDGGCAGIVVGDMAMSRGVPECVSRVCVAVSMVLGVTWVLKSMVEIVVIWDRAFSCSCDGSS